MLVARGKSFLTTDNRMIFDLLIIGAGPAGLSAAGVLRLPV